MDTLIRRAIAGRLLVAFTYHGHHRVGEPHVYGRTNGRVQLLIYQTGGTSSSGRLPDWRRCDVDEITGLRVQQQTFRGSRRSPSGDHSDWDETWAIVR
jgi:hypothetical protein